MTRLETQIEQISKLQTHQTLIEKFSLITDVNEGQGG